MQKQTKLAGKLEKNLSQLNQVKQNCSQGNKGSEREGPRSLSPEALCKTCALFLAVSMPHFEPWGIEM